MMTPVGINRVGLLFSLSLSLSSFLSPLPPSSLLFIPPPIYPSFLPFSLILSTSSSPFLSLFLSCVLLFSMYVCLSLPCLSLLSLPSLSPPPPPPPPPPFSMSVLLLSVCLPCLSLLSLPSISLPSFSPPPPHFSMSVCLFLFFTLFFIFGPIWGPFVIITNPWNNF